MILKQTLCISLGVLLLFFLIQLMGACTKSDILPGYNQQIVLQEFTSNDLTANPTLYWNATGWFLGFELAVGEPGTRLTSITTFTLEAPTNLTGEPYSYTITDDVYLEEEVYEWKVSGYNEFRYFASEASFYYAKDSSPPTIEIETPTCNYELINSGTDIQFSGTIFDRWGVQSCTINVNETGSQSLSLASTAPQTEPFDWSYSHTFSEEDTGDASVVLTCLDSYGNKTTETCNLIVDRIEDSFDDSSLSDSWTTLHHDGSGTVDEIGSSLVIGNGDDAGSFYTTPYTGSMIYQLLPSDDFEAVVQVVQMQTFSYTAVAGVFCDASDGNTESYLISSGCCGYPSGVQNWGLISRTKTGSDILWQADPNGVELRSDFYIKISKSGTTLSFAYSTDGSSYTPFSFSNLQTNCTLQHIGLLSGSSSSTASNTVFGYFAISVK